MRLIQGLPQNGLLKLRLAERKFGNQTLFIYDLSKTGVKT